MGDLTDKEKGQANQEIFNKYSAKAKQDKKSINRKTIKMFVITIVISILLMVIIIIGGIIENNIRQAEQEEKKNKQVTMPNLIGMTYTEAEEELSNLGLNIERSYGSSDSNEAIVTNQGKKEGYTVQKGDTISVTVYTQQEISEKEEKQKKEAEESRNRSNATLAFAETVERANSGSVKYKISTYYGSTETSGKVYKIKYTTSSEYLYYYQLVSYNSDYTKVVKSTKLFSFYDYGNGESGQTQELEYAYKTTF